MKITAIEGLQELLDDLGTIIREVPELTHDELFDEAQLIFVESQQQVPVDTGNLRSSGYVDDKGDEGIYIGYSAEYAVYPHEDLTAHHEHGKAKYLTDPVDNALQDIQSRVAAKVGSKILK